jgi:hypothetical protein
MFRGCCCTPQNNTGGGMILAWDTKVTSPPSHDEHGQAFGNASKGRREPQEPGSCCVIVNHAVGLSDCFSKQPTGGGGPFLGVVLASPAINAVHCTICRLQSCSTAAQPTGHLVGNLVPPPPPRISSQRNQAVISRFLFLRAASCCVYRYRLFKVPSIATDII